MATRGKKLVYTVEETRKRLGLSRGAVYEGIKRGELPGVRVGRRILIPCAALEKLLSEAKSPARTRPHNDQDAREVAGTSRTRTRETIKRGKQTP